MGFAACGIARVHLVPDTVMLAYDRWIENNHHGGMAYMANHRDIRRDPSLLLPGAVTLVSLAVSYTPPVVAPMIAHYAQGRDYHVVVRDMANRLAVAVVENHNAVEVADKATKLVDSTVIQSRVCIDTAPIFERYWAEQAGVGWIGRNRMLIVPGAGTEHFLCEILLTDVADNYDIPIPSRCGTCRRCLDACPTGALGEECLCAERCNSYLTIEHRGDFGEYSPQYPEDTPYIYGCDICQKVCPHNRHACPTQETAFHASDVLLAMTPDDWHSLTVEQYRDLFRHSAVKRTKYEGLMRNIRGLEK